MKTLCIMEKSLYDDVFPERVRQKIAALAEEPFVFRTTEEIELHPELLRGVEVVFGSWGSPRFDERLLRHADSLKAVLFAAGSVKAVVSDAFWQRGLRISSAASANAVPVAEFALGEILLSLKRFFARNKQYQNDGVYAMYESAGGYNSHVGLVSYGMTAKALVKLLKPFDLFVHIYSPELDERSAAKDGLIFTPLDELFRVCDVVSLHTPLLPSTVGLIQYRHIVSMKQNATLINTARGAVIDEEGLIKALRERSDVTALLDVTEKEPLPQSSPLRKLANAVLTPHIAGACGAERARAGMLMAEEFERFVTDAPLRCEVTRDMLSETA